ncbi:MAG TPA: hypothetical protein VF033_02095 [Steroidobacteraceae bacterium]
MSAGLEGGCACGAVRYRLASAPFDAGYCHCEVCRRSSGAPVSPAWFDVRDSLPRHARFRPDTRGL